MGTRSRTRWTIGLAVATLALAAAAFAETAGSSLPAAVQRLLDCRKAEPDPARLACYDHAVDELSRLIASGERWSSITSASPG